DVDADELGARLVVADRLQRLAEGRVHDDPHHQHAGEEEPEHVVVVVARKEKDLVSRRVDGQAQERGRRHSQPVGAAGDRVELEGQAPQHLRERQREDAEEDARIPHADEAEERDDHQRGEDRPEQEQRLHRRARLQRQGDGAHAVRPNSPAGRTRSTTTAIRYSTASSTSGNTETPNSRTIPTIRAPTSAPSRLPRPPTTTTTKASTSA